MIRWAEVPRGSLGDELTAASEAHAISRCLAEQGVDRPFAALYVETVPSPYTSS